MTAQNDHSFAHASGTNLLEMSALAYRWEKDKGFRPTEAESFVLENDGQVLSVLRSKVGWLTGTWRSLESGVAFIADSGAQMHRFFPRTSAPSESTKLPAAMAGVWG